MSANLIVTLLLVLLVWTVFGAMALASFQDSYVTDDHRDPLIVDLPRWQIAVCGPVAWALYLLGRMRQ